MSLTSRKKRPLDRELHPQRDSRLVIIATEGSETEPQYFRAFERRDSRIQVEVLGTERGESAPRHVLKRLRSYRDRFDLGKGDALFLAIDEDKWPVKQLAGVASEARRQKFVLAVSCPCFDVWLYLHHADPPPAMQRMSSQEVKVALRSLLGEYNPSKLKPVVYVPKVTDAIRRARNLDPHRNQRWPNRPGTRVYLIMECILGSDP